MIVEPLFNLPIPDNIATLYKHYLSTDEKAIKLVVLEQAYTDVVAQTNIEKMCRWLTQDAGIHLITVEGSDQQILSTGSRSIEELITATPNNVSAGVLRFTETANKRIIVWGVEQMESKEKSTKVMFQLDTIKHAREKTFNDLRDRLRRVEESIYPKEITNFQQGILFRRIKDQLGLIQQVKLIQKMAEVTQVDLSPFPSITGIGLLLELEKSYNRIRLQWESMIFRSRIRRHVTGWYKIRGKHLSVDFKKFAPFLAFYANSVGMSEKELEIKMQGKESMNHLVEDCRGWLYNRVSLLTSQWSSFDQRSSSFEDLMSMALQTNIPYFDLKQFRRYVTGMRVSDELAARGGLEIISEQIFACLRIIMNAYELPQIKHLFDIESRLDAIYRAITLEISAREAEYIDIGEGAFHDILVELIKIEKDIAKLDDLTDEIRIIDNALGQANQFLEWSRLRGDHMLRWTLELIEQMQENRAILVAGGFHARQIAQTLEDNYPHISWMMLIPKVNTNNVHILSNN